MLRDADQALRRLWYARVLKGFGATHTGIWGQRA